MSLRNQYCRAACDFGWIGHDVASGLLFPSLINSAFRRSVLLAAGQFTVNGWPHRNDLGIGVQVWRSGAELRPLPSALVYIDFPRTFGECVDLATRRQPIDRWQLVRSICGAGVKHGIESYRAARNSRSRPSPLMAVRLAGLNALWRGARDSRHQRSVAQEHLGIDYAD